MPTVAEILKQHVVPDVECFDRLYLNGYPLRRAMDKVNAEVDNLIQTSQLRPAA